MLSNPRQAAADEVPGKMTEVCSTSVCLAAEVSEFVSSAAPASLHIIDK